MEQSVELSGDHVVVRADGVPVGTFAWDDVVAVSAYAMDVISHVTKYVEITLVNGEFVEVRESMRGWAELLASVGDHVPTELDDIPGAVAALGVHDGVVTLAGRA